MRPAIGLRTGRSGAEPQGFHRLRTRRWLWGAAAATVAFAVLLLALRQPLSERFWPDTRIEQLRMQAEHALARGELSRADGHGARELFQAALALDPDRGEARAGLARVASAALEQARADIAGHRFPQAHQSLALASELGAPRARVEAIATQLREHEAAEAGIDALLERAALARREGRLYGSQDGALALYQRVLSLQPSNTRALEGREDTVADLLQHARTALSAGSLENAARIVRRAQAADPGHADLPAVLSALSLQAEQHRLRADGDLRRGRLERALAGYRTALAVDPGDVAATRGRTRVADAYAGRGERLAADFRFEQAEAALRQALAADPQAASIAVARSHLLRARQSQMRLGSRLSPALREQRLRQWLQQAQAAEARGDLLTPPGDSAFDKLRAARAIAPRDPRVLRASARLLPAARSCFEDRLRANRLQRAGECLDAWAALGGQDAPMKDAAMKDAGRRLAQRWVAVGDERLGAGELQAAQQALAAARRLDASAAGLNELSERVLQAAAVAD